LERAGVDLAPEAAVQVWLLGVVAVTVACSALAPSLAFVAVPTLVGASPFALRVAKGRGDRRVASALPQATRSVAAELRAGGTIHTAIGRLAEAPSPLRPDFAAVAARLRMGASIPDALAPWPDQRPVPGARALAGALAAASEFGGGAAVALDGLAASLDDRLTIAAETRAQSAQARVSAVVVALAPAGYLGLSVLVDRSALDSLFARPVGRVCLAAGLGMDVLAVVWMRRLTRSRDAAGL
jgi:tight adherence protein B